MRSGSDEAWFLLAVIALIAAAVANRSLRRRRRQDADPGEPLCGRCGYNTRGLTTLTCPECGADLRDVGIGPGVVGARNCVLAFLLAAAFLSACVYSFRPTLWRAVQPLLPSRAESQRRYDVVSAADVKRSFEVEAHTLRSNEVRVTMRIRSAAAAAAADHVFELAFDPATNGYRYPAAPPPPGGAATTGNDFGPDAVRKWMESSGAVPPAASDPAVAIEAARIAGLARQAGRIFRTDPAYNAFFRERGSSGRSSSGAGGPFSQVNERHTDGSPRPLPGAAQAVGGLCFLLWLALLGVLFRAILQRPHAAAAPPFTSAATGE